MIFFLYDQNKIIYFYSVHPPPTSLHLGGGGVAWFWNIAKQGEGLEF